MKLLDEPVSFVEAIKSLVARRTLPTNLGSAELKQIDAGIRRQSLFSARTLMEDYLGDIRGVVQSIIEPQQGISRERRSEENPEGRVTVGLDPASARLKLKESLKKYGYAPGEGERGTIKDLSSDGRINLVVKTNVELAQGAGHFIQGQDEDVLDAFPAQELVRFEARTVERDWEQRWREAARYAGDGHAARALADFERMAARKDSGIWDALGSSELFDDALDNPYPPFAFNSGMWVVDVSRAEAEEMELIGSEETPAPQLLDLANLFSQ